MPEIRELVEIHVEEIRAREQERQQRWQETTPIAEGGAASLEAPGQAPGGILVAEGDSWFDYPGTDVLSELEGLGFDVHSVAHRGDTLESMAYGSKQLDGLFRKLGKLANQGSTPRSILLSAGGNDIAGDELRALLNHARSGLPALNDTVVRGTIDERLRAAYVTLLLKIRAFCQVHFGLPDLRVVVHGYDYPVPDGRGFLGGWWFLPGPWLEPSLRAKGYDDLDHNAQVMRDLIDRFNDMLGTLSSEPGLGHVRYADLRDTLNDELTGEQYKQDWDNELHPEDRGFQVVARKIAEHV